MARSRGYSPAALRRLLRRLPAPVRLAVLVMLVAIAVALAFRDARPFMTSSEGVAAGAFLEADVVRVVDGDTAVFRLPDGSEESVRFIGVDTPESTREIEAYGREASEYTRRALVVGTTVTLEIGAEERDRYGRVLAYVWLEKPDGTSAAEVRAKMLNAHLALDGYAQQMTIQPNSKYADVFRDCVREAREAERGLWDPAAIESGK